MIVKLSPHHPVITKSNDLNLSSCVAAPRPPSHALLSARLMHNYIAALQLAWKRRHVYVKRKLRTGSSDPLPHRRPHNQAGKSLKPPSICRVLSSVAAIFTPAACNTCRCQTRIRLVSCSRRASFCSVENSYQVQR